MSGYRFLLFDPDGRRRAAIVNALAGRHLHVEPFDSFTELTRWPSDGIILVNDEASLVADVIDRLHAVGRDMQIIAYAETVQAPRIVQAVLDGAVDYLIWPFSRLALIQSMGRSETTPALVGHARRRRMVARRSVERLTPREREVLQFVSEGRTSREIGEQLQLSPRTVEIHRHNMVRKLGGSNASAVRVAIEASLVA